MPVAEIHPPKQPTAIMGTANKRRKRRGSAPIPGAFVHVFRYVDEPVTGRTYDGENCTIVCATVADTPYPEIGTAAKKVHAAM